MTASLLVLTLLIAAFATWLIRQSINVRPWIAESASGGGMSSVPAVVTAPRVGLVVFLAVVTSVFALTLSAYMMRMAATPAWEFLPNAGLAWINTAVLLLASVALQTALGASRRGQPKLMWAGLAAGGLCTLAFIAAQYLLWRQLNGAGFFLATHPAGAFFVLMSTLHALHLAGGLYVLGRAVLRSSRGGAPARLREAMALCAVYWHYLLFVWLVLFGALFVGALPLYELCRSF